MEYSEERKCEIMTRTEVEGALGAKRLARARLLMRQACARLEQALAIVREVQPEAEIYVNENCFHLMSGPAHEGRWASARQDRCLSDDKVQGLDCGGW